MEDFKYYIIIQSDDSKYCLIDKDAKGVRKEWNLLKGIRMESNFPVDAKYYLSKNHKGTQLTDFIVNYINLLIVSEKVKRLMDQGGITDVEFLPFTLYDRKDRIVNDNYFVANLLGSVDCLDLNKSVFVRSAITQDEILSFRKVLLHTEKIPKDKKLFRLKEKPTLFIIRSDFVVVLAHNKVTGIDLLNIGEDVVI